MEDLKALTVKYLRELARKHLGKGHSKLKTREELVLALKEFLPARLRPASAAAQANTVPAQPDVAKASAAADKQPTPTGANTQPTLTAVNTQPTAASELAADEAVSVVAEQLHDASRAAKKRKHTSEPIQHEAEPLVEGFFVARIVGHEEARRHHLTDDSNRHAIETRSKLVYEEHLGELPSSYGDDSAIALPRDPQTVFFYWDFNQSTQRRAFDGLTDPKALLRIYDGETLVRELDFALESKSFYVQGLTPGRRYRLEAHAVGRDGKTHRIGRSTNMVAVPWEGPSADPTVRFLRAPWTLPVGRMMDAIRGGEAKVTETVGQRTYLDMEEWEENANSATHIQRRVTERTEAVPGRERSPSELRRKMLGASDRHLGASSGWPSGRK